MANLGYLGKIVADMWGNKNNRDKKVGIGSVGLRKVTVCNFVWWST